MKEMKIGSMLFQVKELREINSKRLCEGICTASAYSSYENNEKIPDCLLFSFFMQRLGVPPEDFSIIVNQKEYAYFLWKDQTLEAIQDKKWNELENLLKQEEAIEIVCNEKIQLQYYYYLKAIITAEKENNKADAMDYLRQAAEETMGDLHNFSNREILLGGMELQILILYLHYGLITNKLNEAYSRSLFEKLERYILETMVEKREQAKYYPKLICIWLRESKENIPVNKRRALLEKSLDLLRATLKLYDITEVLRQNIKLLSEIDVNEQAIMEKQYNALANVMEEAGASVEFNPPLFYGKKPKLYLLHELFYSKRQIKKMTQEELSEGICAPESYSRVETGKRMPTTNKYYALAKKLDIKWGYYKGELVTDNYEVYQLRLLQRRVFIENRWEDGKTLLRELAEKLDMMEATNYRYIESNWNMAEFLLKNRTPQEAYEKHQELLKSVIPDNMEELQYYHFTQADMEIIAQTAMMLRKMERYEEGSTLVKRVLQFLMNSKVDIKYQWNGADFLIRVLSGIYFSQKRYEESLKLAEYSYRINIRLMDAGNLNEILDDMADNLEHMGETYKNQYYKMYRNSFYIADVLKIYFWKDFMKNYYEENFDANIKWY